jgi:multidrug efflux pump subunit AcrA (membrane-fusion protein)
MTVPLSSPATDPMLAASAPGRVKERKSWVGHHFLSINTGDPSGILTVVAEFLGPFRYLVWLCVPIALAGFSEMFRHQTDMWADLDRLMTSMNYWTNLLVSLIFTSMFAKIWEGIVMAYYGAPPEEMGLRMMFGIWPRVYVARKPIVSLGYPQQRNCYLAPALFRLMMFAVGILVWGLYRRTGSGFADLALVISNAGLWSFIASSNPIWHADGYRMLAAQLAEPKLRENSIFVLTSVLTLRRMPKYMTARRFWGLLVWATCSALFTAFFVLTSLQVMAQTLTATLYGFGALMMVVVIVLLFFYLKAEGPAPASIKRNARKRDKYLEKLRADRHRVAQMAAIMAESHRERNEDLTAMTSDSEPGSDDASAPETSAATEIDRGRDAEPHGAPPSTPPPPDQPPRGSGKKDAKARAVAAAAVDTSLDDILVLPASSSGKDARTSAEDIDSLLDSVFSDGPLDLEGGPGSIHDLDAEDPAADLDMSDLWGEDPVFNPATAKPAPAADAPSSFRETPSSTPPVADPDAEAPPAPPRRAARRPANDPLADLDRVLKMGDSTPSPWRKWRNRLIWIVILAIVIWVAFLPFPYQVGGNFTVTPLTRSEARSRIEGEIMSINVKEGDWVKQGDVLAVMSDWDQKRDVAQNEADDAKLRADLATMTDGATPQEIEVAKQDVASAEVTVRTTKQNLDRQEALFKSGTISEKVIEDARDAYDSAVAARDSAQAKLDLVSAPTRDTEIAAQKASIDRNSAELDYSRAMLDYTRIRATSSGQIVTDLTKTPIGAHLALGGLFTAIEENRTAIASVDVPETSIDDVRLGAEVELRLWSDPLRSVYGTVKSVAPSAEQRDYGWVIRVDVEVPNPDGRLQSNMTGFGKIRAADRPVWQAFSQTIIGFFKIELWSWLP